MTNKQVMELTSGNFDEAINGDQPILVDFWAPWCGPCRMVGPLVDEVAQELTGRARVGKVNVDEQSELAMRFQVMTIPTICVFKNGELLEKSVGAKPKHALKAMLEKHLNPSAL